MISLERGDLISHFADTESRNIVWGYVAQSEALDSVDLTSNGPAPFPSCSLGHTSLPALECLLQKYPCTSPLPSAPSEHQVADHGSSARAGPAQAHAALPWVLGQRVLLTTVPYVRFVTVCASSKLVHIALDRALCLR